MIKEAQVEKTLTENPQALAKGWFSVPSRSKYKSMVGVTSLPYHSTWLWRPHRQ
jgi:hypothetical protein